MVGSKYCLKPREFITVRNADIQLKKKNSDMYICINIVWKLQKCKHYDIYVQNQNHLMTKLT